MNSLPRPTHRPIQWLNLAMTLGGMASIQLGCGDGATPGDGVAGATSTAGGAGANNAGGGGGSGGQPAQPSIPTRVPGTDSYDCSPPTGAIPSLRLAEVTTGLQSPVLLVHAPNDDRLFIVEQRGTIQVWDGTKLLDESFLDIQDRVRDADEGGNEQGLLGLAFHPDYADNGLFYVHYSAQAAATAFDDGDTVVAEYRVSSEDPNVASPEERVVFDTPQPNNNHNGGTIAFGPDGMLYIGLGDGGASNDLYENGQDASTPLGAILRIDPRGASPYSVPSGNLQEVQPSAAPEVWDYGLRNPYRFNFDACEGHLFIADVGQDAWEEVNVEPVGTGSRNYGWPIMEGTHCAAQDCDQMGLTLPVAEYAHADFGNQASVTGGSVYRGSAIPSLRGHYFYADFLSGSIWSLTYDSKANTASPPVDRTKDVNPTSLSGWTAIQTDHAGELYFLQRSGSLYRLEAE